MLSIEREIAREQNRLRNLLASGLPSVYADWYAYCCDLHPAFPWKPEEQKVAVVEVLADAEVQRLAAQLKQERGWDYVQELNDALAFDPNNC